MFRETERVVTLYSQGVNQSAQGTDKVNAILNCHLATGRIGKPGASPFSLTGQPNAMGGREVGGLANQLAAHMGFTPPDIDRVRRFWKAPRIATHEGLKAVQMFEAIARGEIKALWVIGTNPAVSLPDADVVREAMKKLELFVVSENVRSNDTVEAGPHVLLPALAWGEKSGTVTNSERRISRQRSFLPAPGEARPDWWILSEVAKRLGFGAAFDYKSAADIFREHAALSAFENNGSRDFDIGALTSLSDDAFDAMTPVQWPIARRRRAAGALLRRRPFLRQRPQGPLRRAGNSGAAQRDQRGQAAAAQHRPHPRPVAHHDPQRPEPAARRASARALCRDPSRRRQQIRRRRRQLCARHHRLRPVHPEGRRQRAPAARHAVRADPLERGECLAARASARWSRPSPIPIPASPRASRRRPRSRRTNMCSAALCCRASSSICRRACGGRGRRSRAATPICSPTTPISRAGRPGCARSSGDDLAEYRDFGGGVYRAASFAGDRIETCLFVGPAHDAGDWDVVKSLFAPDALSDDQRRLLLSGRSTEGVASTGPVVCACFGVGRATICDAIAAGARSAAEIGAKLKAGTNCGSCIPELKRLIAQAATRCAAQPLSAVAN